MDATFLEIHNQNLYTATELFNLKTVFNKGTTLQQLMKVNAWAEKYYPTLGALSITQPPSVLRTVFKDLSNVLMYPINFTSYVIFQSIRGLKNRSLQPLMEISGKFKMGQRNNLKRICSPYGGYEEWIKSQFEIKLKENFKTYYKPEFMDFLFPKRHFKTKDVIVDPDLLRSLQESFTKYSVTSPQ
jgi:hypothetical protein